MRVTIHQASELNVYGSIANFTPYILFHIGGKEVFKTVRKRSTQNPAYGQTFEYYFNDITDAEIAADVRHLDPLREDPSIGTLTVKIADAIARKQGDDWFTLFK